VVGLTIKGGPIASVTETRDTPKSQDSHCEGREADAKQKFIEAILTVTAQPLLRARSPLRPLSHLLSARWNDHRCEEGDHTCKKPLRVVEMMMIKYYTHS
jgi:hypothetical protein